jgi:hypothetical protein
VALGDLSATAQNYARRNDIKLMQGPALALLLKDAKLR